MLRTVRARHAVRRATATLSTWSAPSRRCRSPAGRAARTPVTGDWRRSPRGVPAGRGPGTGRGALHRRGAAGRGGHCRCRASRPDGLAVFGARGRPAHDHRPPRAAARCRGAAFIEHAAGRRLSGRRGRPDRPGRLPPVAGATTGAAIPATWPLAERFGRRVLGVPAARPSPAARWAPGWRPSRTRWRSPRRAVGADHAWPGCWRRRSPARRHAETERELSAGPPAHHAADARSPGIPGMSVAARYVPTGGGLQVGGDWYDMIPLPVGTGSALVIGDVQGHDVRAAGLMGQLRIALRAYASEGHRPDAVLSRASRFLAGMGDGARGGSPTPRTRSPATPRFATCLYMEVDPATGILDIARAGHPDPAIRHGRRHGADPADRGRPAAGHRPGRRLSDDPAGAGARRDDAALHGRADRDRRPRPRHRLAAAPRRSSRQ